MIHRAADIRRWVRVLGTNELSSGEEDDDENDGLLQCLLMRSLVGYTL